MPQKLNLTQARLLGPLRLFWCRCDGRRDLLQSLRKELEDSIPLAANRDRYEGQVVATLRRLVSGTLQKTYDVRPIKSDPSNCLFELRWELVLANAPGPLRLYFGLHGENAYCLLIRFKNTLDENSKIRQFQNRQIQEALSIFEKAKQSSFSNCLEESWLHA